MGEKLFDSEDEPKPAIDPSALPHRADWLTGPADDARSAKPVQLPEPPKLSRPGGMPAPDSGPSSPSSPMSDRPARQPGSGAAQAAMPAWAPPPPSVPKMRRNPGDMPAGAQPGAASMRDFPMDDAEERARISARQAEEDERAAALAARPHEVVKPQEFEMPALPVPWWARIPQIVATDRRVQIALAVVVLAVGAIAAWPHPDHAVALANLKSNPERYGDAQVRVAGRVGEVFSVGGSWAFTLVQGRDTIVVFSRTRNPKPRETVTVVGTLSTGRLDGTDRVALFEATGQ